MLDWLLAAVVLMLFVWQLAPQQLPVSLYKLSLIALAAVAGYWIDRSLFPYARPDWFLALVSDDDEDDEPVASGPDGDVFEARLAVDQPMLRLMGVAMLRRAIIVAAAMIAVGLGA
jgi:hypothetical protein